MTDKRVEFNVIRDDFSIYELENGQILKAKFSLIDIVNSTDNNDSSGKLATQPFSAVLTPSDVKLYDFEYTQGSATSADEVKELEFTETQNVTNIYETKKSVIMIGIKIRKIYLTNKLNNEQEPILRYESITAINVIEKPFLDNRPYA